MPLIAKSFSNLITFTRASTATYFAANGVLTSAANNEPRFDYDPTTYLGRGILIEESRTNSIRNNTMVGAVAGTPGTLPTNWVVNNTGGLTTNVIGVGISAGINYVDLQVVGTSTGTIYQLSFDANSQISASAGQSWAGSFWVAQTAGTTGGITGTNVRVSARDSGGLTLATNDSAAITLTGTLARYASVYASLPASTAFVQASLRLGLTNGAAIDITLRIGLPQLELGAFATSVIPTTTTALTRSADDARVNVLSPWYNQSAGTLFVERIRGPLDATVARRYVNISDGTFGTNVAIQNLQGASGSSNNVSYIAGVSDFAPNPAGNSAEGAIVKTATAIDGTGKAMCRDGGTVSTSAVLPALSGMTTMFIGGNGNLPGNCDTWIRRITYYPRRLSNADLQTITT